VSTLESRKWWWQSSGPLLAGLLALRLAIGWHFFYEGISKLLAAAWTSAGYLSTAEWMFGGLFQAIAATPWMVGAVDIANSWGLTIIGLCLLLGLFTRISCVAGSVLLLLYSLAHPALPGMAGANLGGGSYLIVDRNIVEALALIMIAVAPPGQLWALDRFILRRRIARGRAPETAGGVTITSTGRRELIEDLVGVPVFGALAAAILGSRAAGNKTAERDIVIAGATQPLRISSVLGKTGNIVSVRDFERLAPNYMTPSNWAYVSGGSGDEQTLSWNEAAFRQIYLRLRVIHSRTEPNTQLQLFGLELPHPIMIAPARQGDLHPDGELATVRGAGYSGAITIISSMATKSIESIAKAASQPVWYQAYLLKDRESSQKNVQRAEAAGYGAICVTLDSSSNGPRDRELRYGRLRDPERFLKHHGNPWTWPTTWDDFKWYRSLTKLPVIPKGIMTVEDAQRSLDLGADAIYISNHGARNFDSGIATIQVLPAIADRVRGRVPIIFDGGIRRGTDILKALALGATFVAIGRPFLYGLAVNGADGVASVVNMLWNELEMAMISAGQNSISSLDKSILSMKETLQGSRFFSS
jgi:4-hydroxymandelate oxidase